MRAIPPLKIADSFMVNESSMVAPFLLIMLYSVIKITKLTFKKIVKSPCNPVYLLLTALLNQCICILIYLSSLCFLCLYEM